jgi:hypothetical protein
VHWDTADDFAFMQDGNGLVTSGGDLGISALWMSPDSVQDHK